MNYLHTSQQIVVAGVIGGPLAVTYLLKDNFIRLGKAELARDAILYGILGSLILAFLWPFKPVWLSDSSFTFFYLLPAWIISFLQIRNAGTKAKESNSHQNKNKSFRARLVSWFLYYPSIMLVSWLLYYPAVSAYVIYAEDSALIDLSAGQDQQMASIKKMNVLNQFIIDAIYRTDKTTPENHKNTEVSDRKLIYISEDQIKDDSELDAPAQLSIGHGFYYGDRFPANHAVAVEWYRRAAEQGNAEAQYFLGLLNFRGEGVPQNDAEAAKWFTKAAEQGLAYAQDGLGFLYASTEGVMQNDDKALMWLTKAAKQGDSAGQSHLATLYAMQENYIQAHAWWSMSIIGGDEASKNNREKVEGDMTKQQITTARALASKCYKSNYQDCE